MATEAEMITQVRELLNEASNGFWTDTELAKWVRQGTLDLSTKARCVETLTTVNLSEGVSNYVLPVELVGIEAVTYLHSGQSLVKTRLRQSGYSSSGSDTRPSQYAHFAGQLHVFPVPGVGGLQVNLFYWKQTTNIEELPDTYDNLVQLYALIKARLKEEKYQAAAQLYTIYIRELQFQRNDLQDRQPDSKDMLRMPDHIRTLANA